MYLHKNQLATLAVSGYNDAKALWMLNLIDRAMGWNGLSATEHAHEATQRRLSLHQQIADCAENGQILIVESGMDCDCCQYEGKTTLIDATVAAFDEHLDHVNKWADGPFSLAIHAPSEAKDIRRSSRDLALEAFEDGHPYSIRA